MKKGCKILAFESSCDETAAAIVEDGKKTLSARVFSQAAEFAQIGGVVPEIASRGHVDALVPLTDAVLKEAGLELKDIDAVAVTYGAGLIGPLLTGVSYAKALAYAMDVPLIPVNHIRAHISAGFLAYPDLAFPLIALVVSGGHTAILKMDGHDKTECLLSTCDDAAGEAFDKVARVLGLPYPGGPKLDELSKTGKDTLEFFRPGHRDDPAVISFSGLKTAAVNLIHNLRQKGEEPNPNDFALSFSRAAFGKLTRQAVAAAKEHKVTGILVAGGVAANSVLRSMLNEAAAASGIPVYFPPLRLCGDNAEMVAANAYFTLKCGLPPAGLDLNCQASLPL